MFDALARFFIRSQYEQLKHQINDVKRSCLKWLNTAFHLSKNEKKLLLLLLTNSFNAICHWPTSRINEWNEEFFFLLCFAFLFVFFYDFYFYRMQTDRWKIHGRRIHQFVKIPFDDKQRNNKKKQNKLFSEYFINSLQTQSITMSSQNLQINQTILKTFRLEHKKKEVGERKSPSYTSNGIK